jgi:hypothetical protein
MCIFIISHIERRTGAASGLAVAIESRGWMIELSHEQFVKKGLKGQLY